MEVYMKSSTTNTAVLVLVLLCIFFFPGPNAAGQSIRPAGIQYIRFKNGSGVLGVIVYRDREKIRVRTAYAVMHVYATTIKRIIPFRSWNNVKGRAPFSRMPGASAGVSMP